MSAPTPDITALLDSAADGSPEAVERLFEQVYGELRKLARSHRRRWVGNETLNTTALIHEAFLKLVGKGEYQNRTHFYATAAQAMRHILVNYAERQKAQKRGSGEAPVPLHEALITTEEAADEMLAVHQALLALRESVPRCEQVVECMFFGGMTIAETAEALGTSPATVKRDWTYAKAWLYRKLKRKIDSPSLGGSDSSSK